jgi:hypothetical protein
MMAAYGQPRPLNVVTVFLILIGLGAGYWMWRFFPAYFDGWTVDHILRETGSQTYKLARIAEPGRSKQLKLVVDKAREDIVRLGHVDDPELTVNLEIVESSAVVTADYTVVVTHPYMRRTTPIHFHRVETVDIKKVDWE